MSKLESSHRLKLCRSLTILIILSNVLIVGLLLILFQYTNGQNIRLNVFQSMIHQKNDALNIALIVAGPPKSGTGAFRDTFSLYPDVYAYPGEHFFWASWSRKRTKCEPKINASEWNAYLNAYESNTKSLSSLIPICYASDPQNREHCNAESFVDSYKPFINNKKCGRQCLFFDKAPVYARRPLVPIFVANLLPKTKYLTILRNPITHIWSNYFHFGVAEQINNTREREETVIAMFNNFSSIHYLNDVMIETFEEYQAMNDSMNIDQRNEAMNGHYKRLIIEYLKRKYVWPKDIESVQDRKGSKVVWSTYHLPVLLIGMFVNNEVFGKDKYANYKWIQFEWLWNNPLDSMRTVKCWVTGNNAGCNIKRNDAQNIKLFSVDNNASHIHKNHKATENFTDYYVKEIKKIFMPQTELLLKAILKDHKNVLIGEWEKWKYF